MSRPTGLWRESECASSSEEPSARLACDFGPTRGYLRVGGHFDLFTFGAGSRRRVASEQVVKPDTPRLPACAGRSTRSTVQDIDNNPHIGMYTPVGTGCLSNEIDHTPDHAKLLKEWLLGLDSNQQPSG
jgi:hypothetical protein